MNLRLVTSIACVALTCFGYSFASAQTFTRVLQCVQPSASAFCVIDDPELSPDGQWFAHTSAYLWPPLYEWWPFAAITSADGSTSIPLLSVSGGWDFNPTWSPDGTHIAFVVGGYADVDAGIWIVDLTDPGDISSYRHLLHVDFVDGLSWSRDGQRIAYNGTGGIHTVDVTSGADNTIVPGGSNPSWAADGAIVFEQASDLWIREANGTTRQLTNTPWRETTPAWAPAGDWIAYASDQHGSWDIWVLAATGGTPVRISSDPVEEIQPSWSGDSQSILFHSYQANDEFWMVSNLPDFTVAVDHRAWGEVKKMYR